ncbi:hypothetical protein LWI29_038096 [Acer saccharum]|uniref:RNase H type-1 domain-containing protein n=1 Tax=Acer saccharum TaxID=4024 RepID=A0AA39SEL4_ACESA|nr:hypothetical protein LWI29_038096 [Acer saccharum]
MIRYLRQVRSLMSRFIRCDLIRISREHNSQADALAKLASTSDMKLPRTITVLRLPSSNLSEDHQIGVLIPEPVGESWMTPIMNYLRDGTLPEDKGTAQRVRRQAPRKTPKGAQKSPPPWEHRKTPKGAQKSPPPWEHRKTPKGAQKSPPPWEHRKTPKGAQRFPPPREYLKLRKERNFPLNITDT